MKLLIVFCFTGLLSFACKQKPAEEQSAEIKISADLQHYEDEVMKIHDEAMLKMNEINKLSSQLRDIKAKAGANPDGTPVMIEGLDDTLEALRSAEQGMMDWMKRYSDTKTTVTPDLMQTFYERELERITQVKMNMINSIDAANAWIAAHPAG